MDVATMPAKKQSAISKAIRDELLRHPDCAYVVCDRAGVSRGGTFYHWMNGKADLMTATLEKLAAELGYEIVLRKVTE